MHVRILRRPAGMLAPEAHWRQPWRIHGIASEFELEDVWELPGRGGPDDEFPRVVEALTTAGPGSGSALTRLLFALRWKLGAVLGWDDERDGLGARVPSLRDRLPEALAATAPPGLGPRPFTPLYLADDEFAAEIANRTMHGVLHLGRVPDDRDGFRVQMAVLVAPNGLAGRAYMAAIRPFRHRIVYPALLRESEQRW